MDPLMRPLNRGEIGVSFFPGGVRDIVLESDYELVDRTFQPGDYCKRSLDDLRSGVVTSIEAQARLVHAINGGEVEGWRNIKELRRATDIDAGDYVIHDDWVGQVRFNVWHVGMTY
jgi:ubiquitin-conjugating enzyme E2 O